MIGRRLGVVVALTATLSSACEIVSGMKDRKVAGPRADAAVTATGGNPGVDGAPPAGGTGGGSAFVGTGGRGGGNGGGLALGGAAEGGRQTTAGASGGGGLGGRGGVPGLGGLPALGGRTGAGGTTGAAGQPATGGASGSGGVTGVGGVTGLGGTHADAAPDVAYERPPDGPPDAPVDTACPAVGVVGTGQGLQGDYFVTTTLTGLGLSRIDATLNFDWWGAPDVGIPEDSFSVRWTGQVQARFSGEHTFIANSDDGIRVWVAGSLIIDNWSPHGPTENTGALALEAGQKYDIKVEAYESGGRAVAQLSWMSRCQAREIIPQTQLYAPPVVCPAPSVGSGTGLAGDYFDNADFTVKAMSRTDATVSFAWPTGTAPAASMGPDTYSVRWTGQVLAEYSGWTTFYVISDDGVRFFVDDALVIDNWPPHDPTQDPATLNLTAGQRYNLRLDYYDGVGGGQVRLLWGGACQGTEIIPTSQLYQTYTGVVCNEPITGTGTGLRGDYFGNLDLTNLVMTHAAEPVDFDWGAASPDPRIATDGFSVRWTGEVEAQLNGLTTFLVRSDDGARLWVDGKLIVDDWADHGPRETAGTAALTAGQRYAIKLEFHETGGSATVALLWAHPCQAKEAVPASQLYPAPPSDVDAGLGGP